MFVQHEFGPFFASDSKILILGSFPSVKSREQGFYYGHPQNRFWKVLARCFQEEVPTSLLEKKQFLLKHQIALWDVIDACEIQGSSDASIQQVRFTDIEDLLTRTQVKAIYLNGKTAEKYFKLQTELPVLVLPSTSSANARYRLDDLVNEWKIIKISL